MNKLEVGMYVKTELYNVSKIIYIEDTNWLEIDKNKGCLIHDETVLKASHNIIDLIEVGDYVNGKQVIDKWEEPFGAFVGEIFIKLAGEDVVPTMRKIETIVTKEQFKNMEYRIGD